MKGCVLEVDLEYPKELRELHNDYPLAPDDAILFETLIKTLKNAMCIRIQSITMAKTVCRT